MGRVTKKYAERKDEILDAAEELFKIKGYSPTTINDLLERVGIAKGTLYYYFRSKDEILDAVIYRTVQTSVDSFTDITRDTGMNALEKLKLLFSLGCQFSAEPELYEYMHKSGNEIIHQRSLVQSVKKVSAMIAEIIGEGISEGLFKTEYPLEIGEFVMVVLNFLFDSSIFQWTKEEYAKKMRAVEQMLELMLHTDAGTFGFLNGMFEELLNKMKGDVAHVSGLDE